MVAMDDENPGSPFDTKDECPSIRNARKQAIRRAFEDLGVKVKDRPVEDYSFHHARRVFEEWNNADLFICLSDELAVAMKLQLLAAGREWKGHVVGFDDSELAKAEYIPSFCQGLDSLGAQAVKTLHDFLLSEHINEWPPFEEKLKKVHLEERYGER